MPKYITCRYVSEAFGGGYQDSDEPILPGLRTGHASNPPAGNVCGSETLPRRKPLTGEWASGARPRLPAAGFRMPLAEPGVRLSLRTGLSLDVYA
jgi:hypothetical protein